MYKELSSKLNFPELEKGILDYWEKHGIFAKSIESRDASNPFIFYEGPPTANGRPGIHHVISRTIKDFVCRLKTMQGYRVERKAGWDTHGLPVEIEVEKQLGISQKEDIEKLGIDKFNAMCRESVWKYKNEWDELTTRIGYWVDLDHPYITYENDYIESIWWILSEFWKKDLLYRGYKITPYCPRCETPLSSHEVSQGYQDVEDPSVFVRMRMTDETDTSFLVWTTTPWTLISNVALALNPDINYVKVKTAGEYLILAEGRLSVLTDAYEVVQQMPGSDLIGKSYEPLFTFCESDKKMFYTVAGDFVSTEDGSGIVHIAPAFGEDDFKVGQKYDLPVIQPVDKSGKFTAEVTLFKAKFVKDADPEIIDDLRQRGKLYKAEKHLHSYPHCWRCSSPLLYFAKRSWFIRTTAVKDRLIQNNSTIEWYPKEVGSGRFGEWLQNNVDWSLSRDRYWGTPLPIWACSACDEHVCIGSVAELMERSGRDEIADLHKPHIDAVTFKCEQCDGTMKRYPEVIDVWFDSGSMPVAQWHYPFENEETFERSFPANFISEGVDQTRGWFYSLLAISTMLFDKPCYKVCLSNDLILDKEGRKMSKSKGNTVDPNSILNEYGADALRWYLLTVSPPWVPTRFDTEGVKEVLRKFFGTLVNVYSFFAIYTNIDKFVYREPTVATADRAQIDRWLISSLNDLVRTVEAQVTRYDLTRSARAISEFVIDKLSNWYVRRCRRRFWKSDLGQDKLAAYETLYEVLLTLSKLIAPYAPFISEEIYLNLTGPAGNGCESVHLEQFPSASTPAYNYRDVELEEEMSIVRAVVNLGRLLRNDTGIKVRQPLRRILIVAKDGAVRQRVEKMAHLVLEELNVKKVEFVSDSSALTSRKAKPKFKQLGPKFGKDVNRIAAYLQALPGDKVEELESQGKLSFEVDGKAFAIELDDVEILSESAEGLAVHSENGLTVALDLCLTPDLRNEGLAREFVNRVQNMRKSAGYDVVDRIRISMKADDALQQAIDAQHEYIMSETLAEAISSDFEGAAYTEELAIEGSKVVIGIAKVQ